MLYEVCRLRIQYVLPGLCPGNKEPIAGDSKKMINVSPLHGTFGGMLTPHPIASDVEGTAAKK